MSNGCLAHERHLGRSEFPSIEHVKEPKGKQAEGGEQHANIGVAHPPLLFHSCLKPSGRVRDFEEPERNTIKLISDADFAPEFVETVVAPFQFSNRDDKFSTSKQGDRWADAAPSYINRLRAWQVSHQSWHTRTPSRSCLPEANIGQAHPNFNLPRGTQSPDRERVERLELGGPSFICARPLQ